MTSRVQLRASRAITWSAVVIGTVVSSIVPLSFPFLDLTYSQATNPPVILPVMIWPLAPVKFAVGLLFGPLAGLVTGVASQVLTILVAGVDLSSTWNWVLAGALGGFIAGWLPRRLPGPWRPAGDRRLAGAAITGLVAALVGFVPIALDPLLRSEVTWAFALGEYITTVVPLAILAALILPIVLVAGLRFHLHPGIPIAGPVPAARPSWRPFAVALALAIALPLAPLYLPSNVRVIGEVSAAAGPAAAPAPGASGRGDRVVSVSLGDPPAIDRSCDAERTQHSPPVWLAVRVTLLNETGRSVGVSWLDYDGRRDERQPIEADGPLYGEWSSGHLFVLSGPDGACLMVFKVLGTTPITIHLRS
jgi:hypothetical protein